MSEFASHEVDLDGLLAHAGSASGAGFLRNWREDGAIDTWLHPASKMGVLWAHAWYRLDTKEDKKTGEKTKVVRLRRWNCLEPEVILKKQYYRTDGKRDFPPTICPFCMTLEWVRQAAERGDISWTEPLFVFDPEEQSGEGEAEDEPKLIRIGGFCGLFQAKDLTADEKKQLKRAGVRQDEAFMENSTARLQYALTVVENADPSSGAVVALEAKALGDALKKVIRAKIVGEREKGDPRKHPYGFRWEYDNSGDFATYEVIPLGREVCPLTKELAEVFEQPAPGYGNLLDPGNVATLRVTMERQCKVAGMPWQELFAPAEAKYGDQGPDSEREVEPWDETKGSAPEVGAGMSSSSAPAAEEKIGCDYCGAQMLLTEFDCTKTAEREGCGAHYNTQGLESLPCRACGELTPIAADSSICPKCGRIHVMLPEKPVKEAWVAKPKAAEPPKQQEPAARRMRSQAEPSAPRRQLEREGKS